MTGPALGNISDFRDSLWLRTFTRNSQLMILGGDAISNMLWDENKPTLMTNFENLTNEEIDNIYYFIQQESQNQKIGKDEVSYPKAFDEDGIEINGMSQMYRRLALLFRSHQMECQTGIQLRLTPMFSQATTFITRPLSLIRTISGFVLLTLQILHLKP